MPRKYKNKTLPRGILIDRGYVYIRIFPRGRLFQKSIGPLSQPGIVDEAIAKLNQIREQQRLGRLGLEEKSDRITVKQACDVYWELHGSKKPTADDYKRALSRIKDALGDRYIDTLTYLDVQNYRAAREKKVAPSSVNREHTVLTHLFNALREWIRLEVITPVHLPAENPGSLVKHADEKPFRRKRVLTPLEFDQFMKSATTKVRRICLAAIHTALRRKDLRLLTLDNVNEATNQLEGGQAKTRKPYAVPITDTMREIINTATGRWILDFTNFRRDFKACQVRAGLPAFQLKDLRRTAARMMLQGGADIDTVRAYLGHTTLTMTQDYVQTSQEQKRVAAGILNSQYRAPSRLSGKLSEALEKPEGQKVRNALEHKDSRPVAQLDRAPAF